MLDKRTSKLLANLAKICSDGSYKIIDKPELGKDPASVELMIRYLQDNEMIDLKYSDESVYCISVLPKGRAHFEGSRSKNRTITRLEKKVIVILIIGCFAAAVLGSMLGGFIGGLLGG